jgi:hypothetical protein
MIEEITNETDDLLRELNLFEPREIAEKFKEMGIRGVPGDACNCPVAVYLSRETELRIFTGIEDYFIASLVNSEEILIDGFIPHNVKKFIKQFDHGKYPELVDES